MRDYSDWWTPKPMTEEQMKAEIAMSRIQSSQPEFDDASVSTTLKALNLSGDKYVRSSNAE